MTKHEDGSITAQAEAKFYETWQHFGSTHEAGFAELESLSGRNIFELVKKRGALLMDVEYGPEVAGLIQFIISRDMSLIKKNPKITATEGLRSDDEGKLIREVLEIFKKRYGVNIVDGRVSHVLGRGKFGLVTWLNFFPDYHDLDTLVRNLKACKRSLAQGGVGVFTTREKDANIDKLFADAVEKSGLQSSIKLYSGQFFGRSGVIILN